MTRMINIDRFLLFVLYLWDSDPNLVVVLALAHDQSRLKIPRSNRPILTGPFEKKILRWLTHRVRLFYSRLGPSAGGPNRLGYEI